MVVEGRVEHAVYRVSFPPELPKSLFAATCRVNHQIHNKFIITAQLQKHLLLWLAYNLLLARFR